MFFRIENVGPLRDAEVDLSKRLIVLTGPNNTGKTYLAWSVYGLYVSRPRAGSALIDRVVDSFLVSTAHEVDVGELLKQHQEELLAFFAAAYTSKIHLCFAAERERFNGASVTLQGIDAMAFVPKLSLGTHMPDLLTNATQVLLKSHLGATILNTIFAAVFTRCEIFPAERIAVNIFAKELAAKRSELVDQLVEADIEGQQMVSMDVIRRNTGRYPWPIRDSLRIANDLTLMSRLESPFADLATDLESEVMGGKIGISSDGEMSYAPHDAPERNLGVHLTASVVKSLSSLVFYFRHLARPNDFLIIDEPELNLHPDSQRKLARILAKAVKRGFKLMMSTHSDYIIRELNHMIMLSKLSPDAARELGYDPECALAPDDVGVYLFNDHTATSVPVTETGFSIQTIDDQINALNADAQRLYARIFDDEASVAAQ